MTTELALTVFDIDLGLIIDRTKTHHDYVYDIDVRKPSAKKNYWIYWGSHDEIQKARRMIRRNLKKSLGSDAEARIVEAKTGIILEVIR